MADIYHLIYSSDVTFNIAGPDLKQILETSVKNNKIVQVTGILILRENRILQLLEGSRASVRHAYERIKKDMRHTDCQIVAEAQSKKRLFSSWYMGKLSGSALDEALPGIGEILVKGECKANAATILDLIRKFSANGVVVTL